MSTLVSRVLREPWTARPWRATTNLAVDVLIGLVASAVVLGLVALMAIFSTLAGSSFLGLLIPALNLTGPLRGWTLVLTIPLFSALLWCTVPCTAVQRWRVRVLLGTSVPSPPWSRPTLVFGLAGRESTWRQLVYHLFEGFFAAVGFTVTVGLWLGGPALLLSVFWAPWPEVPLLMLLGVVAFHLAPWVAVGTVRLDLARAVTLLGPSRRHQLAALSAQVETVVHSRADVIAAADAERRRIERDLHDGAQQRLVSLAMNLGMARLDLDDVPDHARRAIEEAHEEAKQALTELRDLVRGLYPAVLDERGLDAALSGISARSPVPVTLTVDLSGRASRTTEAVAYFVVSEALANVAKHSGASRVDVRVSRRDNMITVVVADDGRGGAEVAGAGLLGLAQRVGSIDGTLHVESPVGGPTVLTAELPCVS
ncbi:sensor histidine kinase [Kutzneria buriramensis]|nr:sensor histidine kinase [Kutzneria buriramensis]